MRIFYDGHIFASQQYGGISRYFLNLIPRIARLGQDVLLGVPYHRNRDLHCSTIPYKGGYSSLYQLKLSPILNYLNNRINKVNILNFNPSIIHKTYYHNYKLDSINGSKLVITVYDMIHELFPEYFNFFDNTNIAKFESIVKADQIIAISEKTKSDLIYLYGINPNKIKVVHLGSNFKYIETPKKSISYSSKPYFLYVGTRSGYKNFQIILKAFNKSKYLRMHANLIVYGGGKFDNDELNCINQFGLSSNIIHLYGNDSLLKQLMISSCAMIYPSLYEGFGLPVVEAMSSSCPVISSGCGSLSEVGGNASIYFDHSSVNDLVGAMERTFTDNNFRREHINLGDQRANLFTWDSCATKTNEIYSSLS
jgi:glycosyltransferase involved in cell wall biosynthesis